MGEARRRKQAGTKTWPSMADCMRQIQAEGDGVYQISLFTPEQARALLADAEAGDADAGQMVRMVIEASKRSRPSTPLTTPQTLSAMRHRLLER
jgi:hypothetical protein